MRVSEDQPKLKNGRASFISWVRKNGGPGSAGRGIADPQPANGAPQIDAPLGAGAPTGTATTLPASDWLKPVFKRDWDRLKRAMMLLDALATSACLVAAYGFRELSIGDTPGLLGYLALLPGICPLWILILASFGAYKSPLTTPAMRMAGAVAGGVGVALLHLILLVFAFKLQFISRVVVFCFALANIATLLAIRVLLRWHLQRSPRVPRRRILVVGTGRRARRAMMAVAGPINAGCEIVGCVDITAPRDVRGVGPTSFLGTIGEIAAVLKENVIDEIVLAVPRSMIDVAERVVIAAETEGLRVRVMADLFHAAPRRLSLDECSGIPFLTLDWVAYDDWKMVVKRVLDAVLSAGALLLTAPLCGAIALAIKCSSPGPVFFRQTRVGHNKRIFRLVKFRSMCVDAERQQASLESLNEAQGPVFKIANDPRVTRVGRLLRRTSLDELPQLWNVLRGDMSLVGPRPLPLRDVSLFDEAIQRRRFSVKPGITCLWQISGRSTLTFAEWLRLDLWYIDNWSLSLDFKLLVQTVPAVLKGRGAT
jgi:exopolysaccharide biosynthesis polyprenyl glycosylphosphotransferase